MFDPPSLFQCEQSERTVRDIVNRGRPAESNLF